VYSTAVQYVRTLSICGCGDGEMKKRKKNKWGGKKNCHAPSFCPTALPVGSSVVIAFTFYTQ
jgi:hypothetical protein